MRLALLFALLPACAGTKLDTSESGDSAVDSHGGGFDTSANGTCSTGSEWTRNNQGSSKMNPGESCIDCHDRDDGPTFTIAGTVMGAIHDPDDCNGVKDVVVTITDADGEVQELTTNSAGNFYSQDRFKKPYTVSMSYEGITRVMEGAQESGDCASCHTQDGTEGAPGRAVVPY